MGFSGRRLCSSSSRWTGSEGIESWQRGYRELEVAKGDDAGGVGGARSELSLVGGTYYYRVFFVGTKQVGEATRN